MFGILWVKFSTLYTILLALMNLILYYAIQSVFSSALFQKSNGLNFKKFVYVKNDDLNHLSSSKFNGKCSVLHVGRKELR